MKPGPGVAGFGPGVQSWCGLAGGLVPTGPGSGVGPVVGRVMSWQLIVGPWESRLVTAHWWVESGPGPSGGWIQVPGRLGVQGVLKQLPCWWLGLCPCLASSLAWAVPGLVPTGWLVELGPSTNKIVGGFQNVICQY